MSAFSEMAHGTDLLSSDSPTAWIYREMLVLALHHRQVQMVETSITLHDAWLNVLEHRWRSCQLAW